MDECSDLYEGTDLEKCELGCALDACDGDFECECEVDYTWECCMDDCDDGDTECEAGCDTFLADRNADPCDVDSFDEMGCCMSNCDLGDTDECEASCLSVLPFLFEAPWNKKDCMDECVGDDDCEADCNEMAATVAALNACVGDCEEGDDACVMGCYQYLWLLS